MHDHTPHAPREGGIRFSTRELVHLAGSVAALSVAFSFALNVQGFVYGNVVWADILEVLPWAGVIVLAGFALHELAHKVAAQRKQMWAEFRASTNGLLVSILISSSLGVVFALPGAVHILGAASDRDSGEISVVGPLTNLAIGYVSLPFMFSSSGFSVGQAGNIWEVVVVVNVFLAGFNMIPKMPLDGAKVWRWNKLVYLGVVGLTVLLGALYLS